MSHLPAPERSSAPVAAERRRFARLKQESLHTSMGPVIDLSRTGMRILTTRRRKGVIELIVFDRSGRRLPLQWRVVWSKRIGFRKHIVGLELVDTSDNVLRSLSRIGTTGFFDG